MKNVEEVHFDGTAIVVIDANNIAAIIIATCHVSEDDAAEAANKIIDHLDRRSPPPDGEAMTEPRALAMDDKATLDDLKDIERAMIDARQALTRAMVGIGPREREAFIFHIGFAKGRLSRITDRISRLTDRINPVREERPPIDENDP